MIAKKRLLPILVAVLMVFAIMPMTAGTVFAEGEDVYTVTVEPGEGSGTAFTVSSTTILSYSDMVAGNYDGKKGCFYRYDGEDAVWYRFPTECPFTAPDGKEFDCWKCSTGGSLRAGTFFPIADNGNITITALWKGPDPYVTLSLPETVNVRYGDTQTAFDISVTEALFPDDIDHFEVRFKNSSFTCTSQEGTIPFTVSTNATGVPNGYRGDECYFAIHRKTSLPFNCQGFINITSDAWTAAEPGTYTATLNVRTVPSLCEDKEIALTLVVPDPAMVHSVTVNKAANPLTIKAKTAPVKYSKLKKKTQTLAVTKVIKFTKDAKDKKTYTLVSAKKGSKSFKKYFKINKTTGKVTIKKNKKMKKGTYKVKVKVKALGNANYKASTWKTVTFKVRVK